MQSHHVEFHRGEFFISTDKQRLKIADIHAYLSQSYWSAEIPIETVSKAIDGSLCFGVYHGETQVAFARMITDSATFAYLCDVFVLPEFQGKGVGTWMMGVIMEHPSLSGLRRFCLVTRDAHALYAKFGFQPLSRPEGFMEIVVPDIYRSMAQQSKPIDEPK